MYPFPCELARNGPTHQMNWQLLRGLDSNIDGWVCVAKQYLLVGYLYRQLRDLRSVYTGGPKTSTEGGPKTLTLEQASSLFLVLGNLYR